MFPNWLPPFNLGAISVCMDMQQFLVDEFKTRKRRNPSYSLRAFSRHLDIPPGRMSELLAGKRSITASLTKKIGDRLGISPKKLNTITSISLDRIQNKKNSDYLLLEEDSFSLVAESIHFALLHLMETTNFSSDLDWIAKRLNVSKVEVKDALGRLARLGYAHKVEGSWKRKVNAIRSTTDIPSGAIRQFHRDALKQAEVALEEVSLEERDFSSIMFAIDPEQLPQAKRLIQEFRRKMDKFFEGGKSREVYRLNLQLLPVTKKEK